MRFVYLIVISFAIGASSEHGNSQSLPADFAMPAGELQANSGEGRRDQTVYFPNLRFPIESGPAYANSQLYRPGGMYGGSGGQCSSTNYSYPWRDTFCEKRRWKMPFCPGGTGHQGQDIRPATCTKDQHWTVAVDDGVIASIGNFSVTLQNSNGVLFRYLHLAMNDLAVREMDIVRKGDRIGKVSNSFDGEPTTIHLHFDIKAYSRSGDSNSANYLPPYTSLVASYKKLMNAER